jgi:uncharacterized protein (DUF1810 family)
MTHLNEDAVKNDEFELERFIPAQNYTYEAALSEIKNGRKTSHWMWYIFPQFDGLGSSFTTRKFSIKSIEEAKAYLDHPILGLRLLECVKAVLEVHGRTANEIFGSIDELKLKSCATLFASISPEKSIFHQLLDKYFQGESDAKTLDLLNLLKDKGDNG